MRMNRRKNAHFLMLLRSLMNRTIVVLVVAIAILWVNQNRLARNRRRKRFSLVDRIPTQVNNMRDLVEVSDDDCKKMLRMDRVTFIRLCNIIQSLGGLKNSKYITTQEKVAMFFSVLAHHTKNRSITFQFRCSGQTVSRYFHSVLRSVLTLHSNFLVQPHPIPDDSNDPRWQKFKGCLGALDGTYIDVLVPTAEKARYMNRKGNVTVNILGVCDQAMKFVYVLTGLEGSAADSRVLRDAINRTHGLKVPKGNYYLCDNGYPNCEGFLTPYKGIHNQIIMACCLLHNYIRTEMEVDPLEHDLDNFMNNQEIHEGNDNVDVIDSLETTPEWTTWRDTVAQTMFNEWSSRQ
ncbi:hypothetical protein ACS0TY_002486 [Phlomoides rotata]